MGSVWGNFSLLLTFIVVIHNVIKKCDRIEGKGSCRKERYVITPIYIHNIPCIHIVLLLKVYESFFFNFYQKIIKVSYNFSIPSYQLNQFSQFTNKSFNIFPSPWTYLY